MEPMVLVWLSVAWLSGWVSGIVLQGHGSGLIDNLLFGLVGVFASYWLTPLLGVEAGYGLIAALVLTTLFTFAARLVFKSVLVACRNP